MDGLSFLIPFVFPGVFIRMIYDRLHPSIQEDKSKYNEIVQSFIISTVILLINAIINVVIIMILYRVNIMAWSAFKEYVGSHFIMFSCTTFILSLIGVPVYGWIIDSAALKGVNIRRKKEGLAKESEFLSPWHAVFENKNFSLTLRPVGFFKGKELITMGHIYPSAADKKTREFKLTYTDVIETLYREDSAKDKEDKLFNIIETEYYDPQIDMLIKFYGNENYIKYLKDNNLID